MELLNNTWFVGILGGIISALLFYPIGEYLSKLLNKNEYKKVIKEINTKVSKTLIMSISEGKIPSPDLINSLLSSLAKRNNVDLKDINSVEETYDDLVYELFETIFISVENKKALADQLIEQKLSLKQELHFNKNLEEKLNSDISKPKTLEHKTELLKFKSFPTFVLAIIIFSFVTLTLFSLNTISLSSDIGSNQFKFIVSLLTAFGSMLLVLDSLFKYRSTVKSRKEKEIKTRKVKEELDERVQELINDINEAQKK